MKKRSIAIGANVVDGPWGGGNQFAASLSRHLSGQGWQVSHNLQAQDLDIILLVEPRKALKISSFNHADIAKYTIRNPDTVVVHRINECDERKNTQGVNELLMHANGVADHTVFISNWLQDIFQKYEDYSPENATVIRNGADTAIFNPKGYQRWDKAGPIKIVTHHWGGNWLKGFDIYQALDRLQPQSLRGQAFQFTYIGNVPEGFRFDHAHHLPPESGIALGQRIKEHHVYITGSQHEPAGMHHVEACSCGLPIAYRKSGALPEYCQDYGYGFTDAQDYEEALVQLITHYDTFTEKLKKYPYSANRMCSSYEQLFHKLLLNKKGGNFLRVGKNLAFLVKDKLR